MRVVKKDFWKYISLSILGMLGSSGTILADTFFVSNKLGANGLAALNIAISVFGLMNGLGMMLGVGGATNYTIFKSQNQEKNANQTFTTAFLIGISMGIGLLTVGFVGTPSIVKALGASADIFPMCEIYLKTILYFSPFFVLNHLFMAFIRNDGNPKLSMGIMISGSLANIILDYIFIYPMNMGIFGAALATGLAPVIGLGTASIHLFTKKNQFHFVPIRIKEFYILKVMEPGLSAFVNELSSSIVLVVFNLLLLKYAENVGVAAYGIIANLALIVLAVFTGISQGIQPLLSRAYGSGNMEEAKYLYKKGKILVLIIGICIFCFAHFNASALVALFNSEQDSILQNLAEEGMKLYFMGFLFVGYNYVTASFFSTTEKARFAFLLSVFRGGIGVTAAAYIFTAVWGIKGVWLAFPVVEFITVLLSMFLGKTAKVIYKTNRYVQKIKLRSQSGYAN